MAAYTAPTFVETAIRLAQVTRAKSVVLRPKDGGDGGLVYDSTAVNQPGVVAITGDAAVALREMFAAYPTAGTNATTSPVQFAINMARAYLEATGKNCNTEGAQEGSFGAAFGFAMVYFHYVMQSVSARVGTGGLTAQRMA